MLLARCATSDRGGVDFVSRDPQRPPRSITVRWKRVDVAVIARTRSPDARRCRVATREFRHRRPEAWQRRGGANSAIRRRSRGVSPGAGTGAGTFASASDDVQLSGGTSRERERHEEILLSGSSPRYLRGKTARTRSRVHNAQDLYARLCRTKIYLPRIVAFYF